MFYVCIYRYQDDLDVSTIEGKRFILDKYECKHFQANWAKVGVFQISGMQQTASEDDLAWIKKEDFIAKGIVNGENLTIYTREMWLV